MHCYFYTYMNRQKAKKSISRGSEKGQILLLLLLILSVVLVIALGIVQSTLTRKRTVRYEDNSLRAYYAAEAGLEDAIPRLLELAHLSGQELDEHLENPTYGLTLDTPDNLGSDATYSYIREVGREPVWSINRNIPAEEASQFDISDSGEVSLENSELEITWLDDSCDANGVCDTAIEAILVWEVATSQNLIYNPSLEIDADSDGIADAKSGRSWDQINGYGSFDFVDTHSYFGNHSQHMQTAASDVLEVGLTRTAAVDNLIPVLPDTTYTLSVYVNIVSLTGGSIRLNANVWDSGILISDNFVNPADPIQRERSLSGTTGVHWERLYITFTTGADAAYLQPFLYFTQNSIGEVYADGFQLEESAYPTTYCDGDQADADWDDPANQPFSTASRAGYYDMERYFFDTRAVPICDPCVTAGCQNAYGNCTNWDAVDSEVEVYISIDQASQNRALRLKSMFNPIRMTLRARSATWPDVTYKMVGQEIVISSTGYYGDTKKTVRVSHGLPSIMPAFDYVLYNFGCVDVGCFPRDLIK